MSEFPPTPDQAKAIYERGGNLLVAASAGSGKTTVMIERVLSLLGEGVGLDRMVICTFTRAAAADMREKLTNKLIEAEEEGLPWASEGLKKLPLAEISTIHSWCQRLIRNYFFAIDADPAFEIADESESRSWLIESVNEAIEEAIGSADPDFTQFYEINERHRSYDKLTGDVLRLYDFAFSQSDPEKFLKEDAFKGYDDPAFCDEIVDKYRASVLGRFEPLAKALLEEAETAGFTRAIPALDAFYARTRGGNEKVPPKPSKVPDEYMPIIEKYERIRAAFKKETDAIFAYDNLNPPTERKFVEVLTSLTLAAAKKYAAKKRKKAKLDYGDLEHLTVRLLENEEIRREISEKYRYVFVDEYQDVNPLQERITGALAGSDLFLVGDVKQSIYAFRMCDPTIFRNKYENPAENGFLPVIRLNDNFRSSRDVLDFANSVFAELMTERYGGLNYAEEATLKAGGNVPGTGVTLTAICNDEEKTRVSGVYSVMKAAEEDDRGSAADAETNVIVNDIVERLSMPVQGSDKVREVTPSDIAVLVESRGERVTLLVDKLRRLGINASVADKLRFTSVPEVCALCEFIVLLSDPTDDVAFCSVALSALGTLTPDDLARVRKSDGAEESFVRLCMRYSEKSDETARKLAALFALVGRYRDLSAVLDAGELIGRLVAEKKWFAVVFASDGAESKADALNSFLKHVNAYGGGGASVGEYAGYIRDETDDYALPPTADSVRVMTIHASKGLEFPFVYLMGTGGKFNFRDLGSSVILNKDVGVAIRDYDLVEHKEVRNRLTFAARLQLKKTLEEEKMRLLYVALTRAKYGLNVYATVKPDDPLFAGAVDFPYDYESGKCFFDWLRPVFARHGFRKFLRSECRADFGGALEKLTSPPDEKIVRTMREIFDRRIEIPDTVLKKSVTAIVTDPDEQAPVYAENADCERAIRKGNAYHKAMELIDFSANFEDEWQRLSEIVPDFGEVKKSELASAQKSVGEFVRGGKIYREQPFIYSPDGKSLVQGIIDLMIVRGNEATIVDYKTSRPEAVGSEQYRRQLSLYARAAEKVLGLKITDAYVYSFTLGKFVGHDISH